jgi:hypothetical protein
MPLHRYYEAKEMYVGTILFLKSLNGFLLSLVQEELHRICRVDLNFVHIGPM